MDKFSYALGLGIGQNLLGLGAKNLSVEDFSQAIKDILDGKEPAISHQEAQGIVQEHFAALQAKISEESLKAEKVFFEQNGKKEGIVTTESGLQYEVLVKGSGKKPSASDQVKCHYEGKLMDGRMFDSSIKRGQPATFGVNQVIPGWVEALQLMEEGDKWRLYIPSELGYGAHGAGEVIPPYSSLIFEVELIEVL
ncbi:peptidylprolyl isomerase FKBP-type [Bacteroides coprosuis DSM 18011]|uniref:Peptidyl-prolyl cis-trans isomerase n=1 Tax=Bacteroides coprosuis DSM 18011 TaxID=679937 RepID=F3ZR82_9BACE|nr:MULTISPECIES: FKBP-type peptidyl-prolyl cis-trans isomerase [Bacteroides]EGJ70675.1 peptidylprolyl isomerase FKBP-type [Bacteroides coprosuis DSM 18011]HJD91054.1 FKBP-type peptidyl-prolyl cis-trans isomerase [Bacteroides coprosuis]